MTNQRLLPILLVACACLPILGTPAFAESELVHPKDLTDEQWQALNEGEVLSETSVIDDVEAGQAWFVVPYTPQEIHAIILDVKEYPRWRETIDEIKHVKPLGPNLESVRYVSENLIDLDLTLKRAHAPDQYVWWELLEGNADKVLGAYNMYPLNDNHTLLEYHTGLELGFWVPGFIRGAATKAKLPESMQEMLPELERRFGKRERKPVKKPATYGHFCVSQCPPGKVVVAGLKPAASAPTPNTEATAVPATAPAAAAPSSAPTAAKDGEAAE